MRRFLPGLFLVALATACGDTRREGGIIITGCVDGQTAACSCGDGRRGSQTCSGGVYGACACTGVARDAGVDAGLVDSGTTVRDAGFPPGRDAGFPPPRDAGFPPPRDAGFPPPRDAGFPPPRDAGFPPPRDAGFPPPRDAGQPTIDGGAENVGDPCTTDTECNIGFPFPLLICEQNMCVYGCLFNELAGIPCPSGTFCDFVTGRCL